MVVEVAGTQRRLTGTADVQYEEWKSLLRELYISETGLEPEDVDIFVEEAEPAAMSPEPDAPSAAPQATSDTPSVDNAETTEAIDSGTGA